MKSVHRDMMGREVVFHGLPRRIVSVVPSQTELLADLGLDEEVVGITRFCIHPERWFRSKTRIGGTKQLNLEKIRSLQPDLIIANKEENTREQIELLASEFPVWISDISDLNGALQMIRSVGSLTGRESAAEAIASEIETGFRSLDSVIDRPRRTAYFIWYRPWMAAGGGTFIDDMLRRAGLENVFAGVPRYPEADAQTIVQLNPGLILLSSEPFPFKEKHISEMLELVPGAEVRLVDGELFSWYGSRLRHSAPYLKSILGETAGKKP